MSGEESKLQKLRGVFPLRGKRKISDVDEVRNLPILVATVDDEEFEKVFDRFKKMDEQFDWFNDIIHENFKPNYGRWIAGLFGGAVGTYFLYELFHKIILPVLKANIP